MVSQGADRFGDGAGGLGFLYFCEFQRPVYLPVIGCAGRRVLLAERAFWNDGRTDPHCGYSYVCNFFGGSARGNDCGDDRHANLNQQDVGWRDADDDGISGCNIEYPDATKCEVSDGLTDVYGDACGSDAWIEYQHDADRDDVLGEYLVRTAGKSDLYGDGNDSEWSIDFRLCAPGLADVFGDSCGPYGGSQHEYNASGEHGIRVGADPCGDHSAAIDGSEHD